MKYTAIPTSLFFLMIMFGCSSVKGLTNEEKNAKEAALREAIEKRAYVVDVDRMLPMNGNARALTSPYSLEVKGDMVKSYLPFYGRAYSIPYGGGEGLNFESTVTGYKSSFDDKGRAVVEFETKTKEDQVVFRMEIFPDGSTSINVISNNRQAISFRGTVREGNAQFSPTLDNN
ncbi:MAG: DUF4251 domain-containing protein [Tannerella sp.]|nr:DUF4251 domain-containing protein [Tannerella sp.]